MTHFRMPAEWEPHRQTHMCWPCRREIWGAGLAAAKAAYAEVARAIARHEPVLMAANPADAADVAAHTGFLPPPAEQVRGEVAQRGVGSADPSCDGGGHIWATSLDDSWARDIGPTFVKDGDETHAIAWRFNAWGGKYERFADDSRFAARLGEKLGMPVHPASIICEGGAIHSDGAGTVLTTEQCLLNPNRNPGLTRAVAEEILKYALGARRVVWLGEGFSDRETDGHVDNIACFTPGGAVLVGVPDSRAHPDHAPVMEAIRRVKAAGLDVIELAQPLTPRHDAQGRLLPASYINFYLCNGGLIMPSFDDPNDEAARATLAALFPDRAISVVPALAIVRGGGGIHCITQQQPA
jgi:agmatine deiminase